LLEEIADERAFYAIIEERIRLLPDGERADAAEYARRLTLCRTCGELNRGTCAQCGCYVEIRAAKRVMRCPLVNPKW
jgi:hypothetical protein